MEQDNPEGESGRPVVLIPAYNPGSRLVDLVEALAAVFPRIVVVDDGSETGLDAIERVGRIVEKVLRHPSNRGKGAAIKTGLAYIGEADVITADADGQHAPADIVKIADALKAHRDGLVLGVRDIGRDMPLRSRFGNFWTRIWFFVFAGLWVNDTQTGLRGIPASLVRRVASLPGERYEYEMTMLADARNHPSRPFEVRIKTLYFDGNSASHFNPLMDTVRIYRALVFSRFANRRTK